MAKRSSSMSSAPWYAWVILAVGVLYLLGDLGVLPYFAPGSTGVLNWWTAAFLLMGLKKVSCC